MFWASYTLSHVDTLSHRATHNVGMGVIRQFTLSKHDMELKI